MRCRGCTNALTRDCGSLKFREARHGFRLKEGRRMPLSSRGHRRACDQSPVVKKRDPLVCDRDDDLERALRRVLWPSVLRRFRVCLLVVVLVFERSVTAWPERVLGPKQKLSVCDPWGEHESGESY